MKQLLAIAMLLAPAHSDSVAKCYDTKNENGVDVRISKGDRYCHPLQPAETITGVWINEFEGSRFLEQESADYSLENVEGHVWLTMDKETERPREFLAIRGHAFFMTIIGRKAVDMNRKRFSGYGHRNVATGLIIVDEVISADDLGPVKYPDR